MSLALALIKWGAGLVAAVWLAVCAWMALFQSRLVYQPSRTIQAVPTDAGLAYEELRLVSSGGRRITAWFVPADPHALPEGRGRPGGRGSVLFCHGNGGNLGHRVDTAQILHRLGLNVLLFDYQGYGESEGSPSERATRADARACWDWLVRERGESPRRILLMGRSLGGAVAARLAADVLQDAPAGLVLESTFTSVPDMGARLYPWLPVRLLSRYRYNTAALLPRLAEKHLPVLVIHSPDDEIVPYALGGRLFEEYTGPKAFRQIMGGHNEGYLLSGPVYDDALNRFARDVLPKQTEHFSESDDFYNLSD